MKAQEIRDKIKVKHGSVEAFIRRTNLCYSTIYNHINGSNWSPGAAKRIARTLGLPESEVFKEIYPDKYGN